METTEEEKKLFQDIATYIQEKQKLDNLRFSIFDKIQTIYSIDPLKLRVPNKKEYKVWNHIEIALHDGTNFNSIQFKVDIQDLINSIER